MEKVKNFLLNHLDFKVYPVTVIALVVGLLIIPCLLYMPQKYGYENGLIESLQMFVLFIILGLCIFAKQNKKFLAFAGLALTIIMIREVNLGRTIFFHIPGTENSFYSWRDIKYGYLAEPIYAAYIAIIGILFLKNGIFVELWKLIKNIKLPVWNLILMGISSFLGSMAEKLTNNNFIFEEGVELVFYTALMGIVYLYSRCEKFKLN